MSDISKLRKWPTWNDLLAWAHAPKVKPIDPFAKQDALMHECRRIAAGRPYALRNAPGGYDVTSLNGDTLYGFAKLP